jgi:hypothetical protein
MKSEEQPPGLLFLKGSINYTTLQDLKQPLKLLRKPREKFFDLPTGGLTRGFKPRFGSQSNVIFLLAASSGAF